MRFFYFSLFLYIRVDKKEWTLKMLLIKCCYLFLIKICNVCYTLKRSRWRRKRKRLAKLIYSFNYFKYSNANERESERKEIYKIKHQKHPFRRSFLFNIFYFLYKIKLKKPVFFNLFYLMKKKKRGEEAHVSESNKERERIILFRKNK